MIDGELPMGGPLQPKVIFLMVGTNDLGFGYGRDYAVKGVKEILKELELRVPDAKVIVHALLPRANESPGVASYKVSPEVPKVNRMLKEYLGSPESNPNHEWLDCGGLFLAPGFDWSE